MTAKASYVTIRDQFCGAGGNTIGASAIPGVCVTEGINHWKRATETYEHNNPSTRVVLTDLHTANPARYRPTDILITSPECPNHSLAKGARRKHINQLDLFGKQDNSPEAERSRMTMWCVVSWAEQHRYNIVIAENVVDIFHWDLFPDWLRCMHKLGYLHECVFFNSMFAWPTPQSRDRIYVVFWRKGNKKPNLRFHPLAWCPHCAREVAAVQAWKKPQPPHWGRYGHHGQYLYRCPHCHEIAWPYYHCAANAIRWDVRGERIGDKQQSRRRLSQTTLERIRYGLTKYAGVPFTHRAYTSRGWVPVASALDPTGACTTIDHHQLIQPASFTVPVTHSGAPDTRARGVLEPTTTQTSQEEAALVVATSHAGANGALVHPPTDPAPTLTTQPEHGVVVSNYNGHSRHPAHRTDEPLVTQSTLNNHSLVTPPFLVHPNKRSFTPTGAAEPTPTQTASLESALIVPSGGTWNDEARSGAQPAPTLTASEAYGLSAPSAATLAMILAERSHATAHDVRTDVSPAVCAGANHLSFIYNFRSGTPLIAAASPLPTQATHEHAGLLQGPAALEEALLDSYFRMLLVEEIQAAMAFPPAYQVLGTKKERVRQLGNACTPPVMRLLLERCLATLG